MEVYLKKCGFEQFIKHDTEIIYSTRFASGHTYQLKYTNNKLSGTANSELIKEEDLYFNKVSFISETRNIIPLWADKGASFIGGYLGFYFHEVYQDFDVASETLKELELNYLNVKFSVKKTNSGKKYMIQSTGNHDNYEIDYKNSSSGTQTSVPISLIAQYFSKKFNFEDAFNRSVLSYLSNTDSLTDFKAIKNLKDIKKKIFIHVEEPELSLFPDAQCQLINDLVSKCFITNTNSIELFLSTHSPYIINHLNLLIKAFDRKNLQNNVPLNDPTSLAYQIMNNQLKGANIDYDKLAVYQIIEGKLEDLMAKNERLINTNPLSDTINDIYEQYNKLD